MRSHVQLGNLQVYSFLLIGVISMTSFKESWQTAHTRKLAVWRIECEFGIISDPECPVDGGWSMWGEWSTCLGHCGSVGHRRRTRHCNNPPPSNDGIPCTGSKEQLEPCYKSNCTCENFRNLIQGDPTRMQAFNELAVVPTLMERCLQKECLFEAIQATLASSNTWQVTPEIIWNALLCVKHNLGCLVTGVWGSWGPWSDCGARCGRGLRWRLRVCDSPPPSNADFICPETPLQIKACEGDQCAVETDGIKVKSTGDWSAWSEWTACSEQCSTGIRRRRRYCIEKPHHHPIGTWGTHCVGQHDELEVCKPRKCMLDGGWSGWSSWGPCSQTCGVGKKIRFRSCTRPIPFGKGKHCEGPKTEVGSCYPSPCQTFSHTVILFNGDSFLQYKCETKHSTLFHFYVRFKPLSPHGTLIRRGAAHNPLVRLSLQKWHVCIDAIGTSSSCTIPSICSSETIEPDEWHTALITVTTEAATLRLDDASVPIRASFPCDPELPYQKLEIVIGERFHGEIEEMAVNFIPLGKDIQQNRRQIYSGLYPFSAFNIVLEKASIDEIHLPLCNGQFLRLPCFDYQDKWRIDLTIKSKSDSGMIIFLTDDSSDAWLHLALQNMRLKLKLATRGFHSESLSMSDCWPDQWFDISLIKNSGANTIEVAINGEERIHVTFDDGAPRKKRYTGESSTPLFEERYCHTSEQTITNLTLDSSKPKLSICSKEFFVGGLPINIRHKVEFIPFLGVIASLSVNNQLLDHHKFSVERHEDGLLQVSSRTASVSGSYHETFWGESKQLNLTCVHAGSFRYPHTAHWLYLDTAIAGHVKGKRVHSIDDGRLLKLDASATDELRGFYTCRAYTNKRTANIVTYGVIGLLKYDFSEPATTAAIAVVTTVFLVLATIGWLLVECIYDLRKGYGFFRDSHLTPEEEADAVCQYIDKNISLIGATAAKIAKKKARLKARRLVMASRVNVGAQEPQGLIQIQGKIRIKDEPETTEEMVLNLHMSSSPRYLGSVPALPERVINSQAIPEPIVTHGVYRCELEYTSSPVHGSALSPRTRFTTSLDESSPRHFCNRLLLAKTLNTSRESLRAKRRRNFNIRLDFAKEMDPKLMTIKSSGLGTSTTLSPGQKVLQKFRQLRCDD